MREDDLDRLDIQILHALQADNTRTATDLAAIVPLSPSAILRRIQGYRAEGLIASDVSILDPAALRERISVMVMLQLDRHGSQSLTALRAYLRDSPHVQFAFEIAGAYDVACLMTFPNLAEFNRVMEEEIVSQAAVRRYETNLVKRRVKFSTAVALGA